MDAFRERLNFRTRRESHTSTCDNEMLDEDLGHPPTCPGTPPGTYVGSLQSDSLLSSSFRSRSRSDVSSPPPIPRTNLRVRSERHSVCVTDLPDIHATNALPAQRNHLFIDTKLANELSRSCRGKQRHATVSATDSKSTMWNPPVHFSHALHLEGGRC
ncbi:unnamed protein product [Gongylonema pulchrum]|uniref:CRIB domain-containing protein n=1 Tax=Gongylonema pulchrum TaxID=637853 RepID=A0A183ENI7_9BILA|nr:unnamed protein product [Gongylonema pulchrum]